MSKQQAKTIDLSKYDSLIQEDTSSSVKNIDLSKYDNTIQPSKKKEATVSSGQESSTGLFSDIADYFATAKPIHSGLGVSQTTKELESGVEYNPKRQLTQEEAIARKKSLVQRAAIDDLVTSTLLSNTPTGGLLSNFIGKPLVSGGASIAGMATNVLAGAVDFFQNAGTKAYDTIKKGQVGTGYVSQEKVTSQEGAAGDVYDFAQTLQGVSNSFMRQAKVDNGIKNEDVDKGYSELIQEGKIGAAFTSLGLGVIQQIPQMVALASTGGSAASTFIGAGLMGTGSAIGEEYAKDKDINGKDTLVVLGKGLVEATTESIFRTDIVAFNKLKSLIASEGKEAVKEEFIRSFGGVVKKALSGAGEEGMEEVIANLGSTIIDSAADDKFDPKRWNDLIQNSIDSFVLGAASGGVMSGMVAKASMTPLTNEQERQIKRYKEVVENDTFSEDIRKAASQKIEDIVKDNADKTNTNYRLIADIEDVNKRAEVIQNLNEIKDEEAKQRELHDEDLVAASNQIIEQKKARVDSIIQENIQNIFGRSAEGIKQEQKLARERAANYLDNNNYYLGFTENNAGLLDSINNNEEIDVKDANKATASLYELEARVIADDTLTNQERNYILRDIYAKIDNVEGYDKITKNGTILTESEIESNRASNSKIKEERVKRVRNDRFDGELFKFTTEDGMEMSLRASVNEKGDVTMKPIRKSYRYKTETEAKANEGFSIKGNLEVGEIKRNQDGDIVSAEITDSKTKKSFRTNNEELVSYLQSLQARESLVKTAKEGYIVEDNIETVAGNDVLSRVTPYIKTRLKNYAASLKSINPNAKIVLYKNESDMAKGLMAQGIKPAKARAAAKGAMGLQYNNVVHANVSTMDDSTIGHEIFHLAVRDISKSEPAQFVKMVDSIRKMLKGSNNKYLTNFSNLYEGNELKAEEFLSELMGVLTAKRLSFKTKNAEGDTINVEVDFELKRNLMHRIVLALREFVQKYAAKTGSKTLMDLASKIGEETNTDEKLAQFFESFSKSLREGLAVDMSYINQLDMKVEEGSVEQVRLQKGVEEVQKNAVEYKDKLKADSKKQSRSPEPVYALYPDVSSMMAKTYVDIPANSKDEKVVSAYDALEKETLSQYDFIISKGLKVEKYYGEGEPYADSNAMLNDLRNNNTLKFLPNENAFGEDINKVTENRGLKPSGRFLEDNYELTISEVFRVVHDYFGHGILGNQFGAIGEENATLQHLDIYSDVAAPAVIFQTRGQNSWVNFSGENTRAAELRKEARKLKKEGKQEEANKLLEEANKIFKFAEPKENIFPNKFNFKQYESARRISEQEAINARTTPRDNDVPELLETYVAKSSGTRGINKRDIRRTERLGNTDVDVIAEYTFDDKINEGIIKAFPEFKGVQKIYETRDAKSYRDMMIASLENHKFAASVTVYSEEDFSKLRMFITEDGSTGVTLGKDGLLGGAFSDPKSGKPNNLAQLMVLGIKEGASIADAFDTILPDYYANFGFKAVARTEFNDEFKPTKESGTSVVDWNYETYKKFNNGKPDLVFFIYDGGNRNTIEDRLGLFDSYSNYEKDNTKFFPKEEYDSADMYAKKEAVKRLEFEIEKSEKEPIKKQLTGVDKSVLLSQDLLSDARKSIEERQSKTLLQWLRSNYKSIYKGAFERNINIRKELEKADMIYALQMMYNKAGASQFAQLKFAQASNEIYSKLSAEERKVLDTIIQLRRFIKIDENFDNQRNKFLSMIQDIEDKIGLAIEVIEDPSSTPEKIAKAKKEINSYKEQIYKLKRKADSKIRPKHGKYLGNKSPNKESSEASLDKMKGEIGEEAFNLLNERADLYFKAYSEDLKYKFDNGLIDEATYNMFKNYDYQPRNFLKFVYGQVYEDADGNKSIETPIDANSFITRGTIINSEELKKIQSGDTDYLEADSAKLLHASMVTTEIRVATNNALKALAESSTLANYGFIKEAEYERYADGKIKVDKDGVPKFKAPSDNRYKNMIYKVGGKKYAFQLKDTEEMPLVEEFNDARSGDFKTSGYRFVSKWLLSNLMKVIATGTNIAFPITNIPIDVISQVHLNDIYTGTVGEQYAQAMSGTLDIAKQLLSAEFKIGDNSEIGKLLYEFGEAGGLMQSLTQEYAPNFGGKFGKITDALGMFGNISELASKLNAYKTSRDILLDEYYVKNGREAQDKDLSKIKTEAAYKSRAAMDYHRGGNWAKYYDGFAPYFNVMLQVGKITASYIKNNPIEFSKKLAQSGAFVMAVTMYNLMVAADDYDNDDVQRDLLNNLVIFNPFKNEDGTRGYTKIAVPSFVKMSLNFFQNFAESLYAEEIVRDEKMAKRFDEKHQMTKSMIPMLMPKLGTAIPPAIKSVIEYTTNYDFYRGEQIIKKDSRAPTSPFLEGVKDKSVAEFWKVLASTEVGKYMDLSPARLQKAANNILPLTNPYVSMGYSIVDKSINQVANLPESYRSKFDKTNSWTSIPASIPNAIKERFTGVTNPATRRVNKEYESIKRQEADKMFEMHAQIKSMVENDAPMSAIVKYAKEQGEEYKQSAQQYAANLRKRDKINYSVYEPDYFAMAFAPNAKAKAEIMYEFEQKNDIPNMKLYRNDLIRFGILTPSVNHIYKQLKAKNK